MNADLYLDRLPAAALLLEVSARLLQSRLVAEADHQFSDREPAALAALLAADANFVTWRHYV